MGRSWFHHTVPRAIAFPPPGGGLCTALRFKFQTGGRSGQEELKLLFSFRSPRVPPLPGAILRPRALSSGLCHPAGPGLH